MTYQQLRELIPAIKRKGKIKENGCWVYTGFNINSKGYAQVKYQGKNHHLHRLVFSIVNNLNYKSKDWQANHKPTCPNKHCFNPEHLYKGDQFDNMQDRLKAGNYVGEKLNNYNSAKTHCPQGHEYDSINSYGKRGCKICIKEYQIEYRKNRKCQKLN